MHALPSDRLASLEQEIVRQVIELEHLPQLAAVAYDTTNFYTHIATTNARPQLPQRGHNKQGRHNLRQLGLALVVDQRSQLPRPTCCTSARARTCGRLPSSSSRCAHGCVS